MSEPRARDATGNAGRGSRCAAWCLVGAWVCAGAAACGSGADEPIAAVPPSPAVAKVDSATPAVDPATVIDDPATATIDPATATVDRATATVDPAIATVDTATVTIDPGRAAERPALRPSQKDSEVKFTGEQAGAAFSGRFRVFDAWVSIDPESGRVSHIRALIDLDTVDTQNDERDGYLKDSDFFHSAKWPQSRFESRAIVGQPDGSDLARARLTLRDQTRDIEFRFRYTPASAVASARLSGHADLLRLDFGVGQGEWRDTEWIGNAVRVSVDLVLISR